MKLSSFSCLVLAGSLAAGCGARTSDEDLLEYSLRGDGDGDGDPATGGRASGGRPVGGSTGGFVLTGGIPGSGGVPGAGGIGGTGALPGSGGRGGSCCEVSMQTGCGAPLVEECVCGLDAYCCSNSWDAACVAIADSYCFADCTMGSGGSGATGGTGGATGGTGGATGGAGATSGGGAPSGGMGGMTGDCCFAHDGRGCDVPEVSECVCDLDAFCCTTEWDNICAREANEQCMAGCSAGGSGGMGAAGGGGGVGGSGATGGTGASGGTGGVAVCEDAFESECGTCVCQSCFEPLDSCVGDAYCPLIAGCIISTGCSDPLSCYQPDTCQPVIDESGGITSSSVVSALALGICFGLSNCPCQ